MAGGMGAVCSRGGGDAAEPVSNDADARKHSHSSTEVLSASTAVEECAAALVEELKVEPSVALRFARARQGDFRKAEPFLRADLAWRAQKTPAMQADCPTALASGAWRMLGCTSVGFPVIFCHVGLWGSTAGKHDIDEYERYMTYIFESILRTSGSSLNAKL